MALRMRSPLPSLDGARWINGEPAAADLEGKPVLVHFWSVSCYLCHDVAETVASWRDTYGPQGLEVIAVHQPRSPEELDVAKVTEDALGPMHITQPCAIDNEHAIVDRFGNQFVPAFYLFNRNHELRHFQAGDKGHDRVVGAIERVLNEPAGEPAA
jgi:thiol-disulfide isomerase/thioredoxin